MAVYKYAKVVSTKHSKYVKSKPCSVHQHGEHCNGLGSKIDPHHLMLEGGHAMGYKESDEWQLSLCRIHHIELTSCGDERIFWTKWGMSYEEAQEICINNALSSPDDKIRERMTQNLISRGFAAEQIQYMRLPEWL